METRMDFAMQKAGLGILEWKEAKALITTGLTTLGQMLV